MKFLQVQPYYYAYLADFYAANAGLDQAPYAEQIATICRDNFNTVHGWWEHLSRFGYDTRLIIPNCEQAQRQWARENDVAVPEGADGLAHILRAQIDAFSPDILYTYPVIFGNDFIGSLGKRPGLVVGWHAAVIPPGSDWASYDLLLSSDDGCIAQAAGLGIAKAVKFRPGFPAGAAAVAASTRKEHDVVFCGQISAHHARRLAILAAVAKAPLGFRGEFDIGYFLFASDGTSLPAGVAMNNRGVVWGNAMYKTIASGRIALNVHIDMVQTPDQNMRIYETLGVGSFLLTEDSPALRERFTPGVELETYASADELIDKIYHYLAHPAEREAIARAGRLRCMREHSTPDRAAYLHHVLQDNSPTKMPVRPPGRSLLQRLLRRQPLPLPTARI